jgi:energy-coupling factor transporter ATP-binding protein EcfA2
MQKITIQQFGPIQQVTLEIKDFILLIGPQATGKSTIAKLIYFFKDLSQNFCERVEDLAGQFTYERLEEALLDQFYHYFEYIADTDSFEIGYEYNPSTYFKVRSTHFEMSDNIHELLRGIEILSNESKQSTHLLKSLETLFLKSQEKLMFIPAGRSALFSLNAQMQSLLTGSLLGKGKKSDFYLDPITISFMEHWEIIKSNYYKTHKSLPRHSAKMDTLSQISKKILKGAYFFDGREEKLKIEGNKDILLKFVSSGQQESVRILEYLRFEMLSKATSSAFVVIEEPEAHLYPMSQCEMVKAISVFSNAKVGTQVILTTHSPYILTALNNGLFAAETVDKYPQARAEMEAIMPAECWLKIEKVGAFYVNEGRVQSIVASSNLIGENELDASSDMIMDDFDAIMDLYKKYQPKK